MYRWTNASECVMCDVGTNPPTQGNERGGGVLEPNVRFKKIYPRKIRSSIINSVTTGRGALHYSIDKTPVIAKGLTYSIHRSICMFNSYSWPACNSGGGGGVNIVRYEKKKGFRAFSKIKVHSAFPSVKVSIVEPY